MDIFTQIGNAIHDFLVNLVGGVFIQIFNEANEQTGQIAAQVSLSPSEWNSGIFTMIKCSNICFYVAPYTRPVRTVQWEVRGA